MLKADDAAFISLQQIVMCGRALKFMNCRQEVYTYKTINVEDYLSFTQAMLRLKLFHSILFIESSCCGGTDDVHVYYETAVKFIEN